MTSIILQTASKFILFIMLGFSIWVLFRGHNAPGGGFVGGLIAASGFALYLLAHGAKSLRGMIGIQLTSLLAIGFAFVLGSGLISLLQQKIFLSGTWVDIKFFNMHVGSPILFDIGVYLIVLSSVLIMIIALEKSQ